MSLLLQRLRFPQQWILRSTLTFPKGNPFFCFLQALPTNHQSVQTLLRPPPTAPSWAPQRDFHKLFRSTAPVRSTLLKGGVGRKVNSIWAIYYKSLPWFFRPFWGDSLTYFLPPFGVTEAVCLFFLINCPDSIALFGQPPDLRNLMVSKNCFEKVYCIKGNVKSQEVQNQKGPNGPRFYPYYPHPNF